MKSANEAAKSFIWGYEFTPKNGANCKSTGGALYSYSTCIATWVDPEFIIINSTKYSVTTTKHQNALYGVLHLRPNLLLIRVREIPRGADRLDLVRYTLKNIQSGKIILPEQVNVLLVIQALKKELGLV